MGEAIAALGIDAGSTTTKVVGVDQAGAIAWHLLQPTEPLMEAQTERLLDEANELAGAARGALKVVATGYGRNLVTRADRRVTEISCHAKGVFRSTGQGGTLVDIGGQDSKVIAIGPNGKVANFAMNDKCAAGTGRFLEVSAGRLQMSLEEFSNAALDDKAEVSISSTCTIFAESEMISLLARGEKLESIVRGLHRSLARRVATLARGVGVKPPLMLSGGVAHSRAIRVLLAEELDLELVLPDEPQLMGAYGAALIALDG